MSRGQRCAVLFLMLSINRACLQVVVPEGEDVLLPCLWTGPDPPHLLTVEWTDPEEVVLMRRDQGGVHVKTGVVFRGDQGPGDFSILLQRVSKQQRGIYECLILETDFLKKINLTVTDAVKKEVLADRPEGGAAVLTSSRLALLLCAVAVLFF